jgi:hypothetical protein
VLCWTLCSLALATSLALVRKRNQPEGYADVNRLATVVLIVMAFVSLVSIK